MKWSKFSQLSWTGVQEIHDAGQDLLVLPCGATEQHGPHLPINTDTVIAEHVCRYACDRAEVPMLPPLSYTVSVGHGDKWPGTFSISHETFVATIEEISAWAVRTGWKRLLLVNSHFGNDAALRVAVDKVRTDRMGQFQIGMRNTFQLTDEIWSYFISDGADVHANKAETDLMLHLAPDSVDMSVVEDDPDRTEGNVFSYPVPQTSLNGITGQPSLGTSEGGRALFEKMADALVAILHTAQTETPPLS